MSCHGKHDIPPWLLRLTFVVEHNPGCASEFMVRLCDGGMIDKLPARETSDVVGFGHTLAEAADAAILAQRRRRLVVIADLARKNWVARMGGECELKAVMAELEDQIIAAGPESLHPGGCPGHA